jgi:Uma2 family endonuclease
MSADEYMARYAGERYEWVRGAAVKMTPVSLTHFSLTSYLQKLLETYFVLNPIGTVVGDPFVMRLEKMQAIREPDLQVILKSNPGQLTETAMIGPADICIEVVSLESALRDYGEKFVEYEQAGVREYWIIDPQRHETRFYRLQETKLYASILPDETGHYHTPLLPRLALHVPTLWLDELPNILQTVQAVKTMFGE